MRGEKFFFYFFIDKNIRFFNFKILSSIFLKNFRRNSYSGFRFYIFSPWKVYKFNFRDDILVNCYDRTLRLYRCEEILNNSKNIEPIQLFQDKINKSLWRECLFTMDGEYVIAGTSRAHDIYIWERSSGGLNHILHGPVGENLTYLTVILF